MTLATPGAAYVRPYLDSSVYIAAIKGSTTEDPQRVSVSAQLLTEAQDGRIRIIASTFLHAEVIRDRGEEKPLDPSKELIVDGFLQRSFISWVERDIAGGRAARALVRRYGVKPPDAVHLAAAVRGKADIFFTWDARLISATGGDSPTGTPGNLEGLLVTTPYVFQAAQQPLDFFGVTPGLPTASWAPRALPAPSEVPVPLASAELQSESDEGQPAGEEINDKLEQPEAGAAVTEDFEPPSDDGNDKDVQGGLAAPDAGDASSGDLNPPIDDAATTTSELGPGEQDAPVIPSSEALATESDP